INADKDLPLNIYMKGRGFAIFQLNVFYNVKTTPDVAPVTDEDAFRLDVNLTDSDSNHILLSICTRLKDTQAIAHTGMAILEVGILSGFGLLPGAEIQADFIRKVDREPQRVSLYLDSVTKAEACVRLPFVRNYNVAHVQDAVLQVYDYYEPTRKTTRMYNSDSVHKRDSCSFCGKNCDSCRPGITIAVRSRSTSGTSCSLTSLFLGAIVFLVSV
ncbi:hypothetical protein XENOCAPTIV_014317, partial [Xenoophorus captivus]